MRHCHLQSSSIIATLLWGIRIQQIPPPKKKNFKQPAKISTPETPQKPKKNTSSSIDGITGCSVTFWSFKGRLEVMGRFFVQSPGRWWVGWVGWFGVQHGFKKKTKIPREASNFFGVFWERFLFLFGGFVWWYLHGWKPKKTSRIFSLMEVSGKGFFSNVPCHSEKNRGLQSHKSWKV